MAHIGAYIKALRESRKYSQRKLGYLSGVSNATINRIENNISNPDPVTLKRLSYALGIPYEELFGMAGYLDDRKFISSNIKLVMEKNNMTYAQLAEEVKRTTGGDVPDNVIEAVKKGLNEDIPQSVIYSLARYEGINPAFFFKENKPEDLAYAAKYGTFIPPDPAECENLSHIRNEELRKWVTEPSNLDYLKFAKKVFDLGISPDFIMTEFINKIFKKGRA